ncbi:MAG: hypothetical protein JSS32_10120 [Verrucomicrobia bacterium]|nr:hypothetical protein [Verrucomicrobiota bacterium]
MKITEKTLNIPPYISTAWSDISSLHSKLDPLGRQMLIVTLRNMAQVEIPNLDERSLKEIFDTFARHKEQEGSVPKPFFSPINFSIPMKKGSPIDSLGSSMAHNPEQSAMPNLPPDMLEKVTTIAKAFGLEDTSLLPAPEEGCNCVHCQIVRSLHGDSPLDAAPEEEILDSDLSFRSWDIKQTAEKLYTVSNPLDQNEHYNVFLGTPLGCTCGRKDCEHIKAVLNS